MNSTEEIKRHYAAPNLLGSIEAGIRAAGKSPETVTSDDLAPVDEFHIRGPAATAELIALLDAGPETHVLDIGSGLGGPARRLATATGCQVTGVDLSADFCAAGNELTRWVGLEERVTLTQGDGARAVESAASPFDAAWSIHVGMNVRDKPAFYAGIARALKPGAPFVIYDVLAKGGGELHFPLPWADSPKTSFLATQAEMEAVLTGAGFEILQTEDHTEQSLAFFEENASRMKKLGGPPPLGLHLVMGAAFPKTIANAQRILAEGLAAPVAIQARRT